MANARITSTGSYAPRHVATNELLAQHNPAVSARWTAERLGINSRRYVNGETSGQMATNAGVAALKGSGIHHTELGLIVVASATPDPTGVSTASCVQRHLGAIENDCPAFDINAVCSGFVYGMITALKFMNGLKHALVIGVDRFSTITDYDNRDCVFFGDAAGAVVLSQTNYGGILGYDFGSQTGPGWCVQDGKWQMDSKAVYNAAMRYMPQSIDRALINAGVKASDIDHVIPHQASLNLLKALAVTIGIDFGKFAITLENFGNTAGASIPFTLDRHKEQIKPGDKVLLAAIGAGWTWGSVVLEW